MKVFSGQVERNRIVRSLPASPKFLRSETASQQGAGAVCDRSPGCPSQASHQLPPDTVGYNHGFAVASRVGRWPCRGRRSDLDRVGFPSFRCRCNAAVDDWQSPGHRPRCALFTGRGLGQGLLAFVLAVQGVGFWRQ